jgi:hypothetical protein
VLISPLLFLILIGAATVAAALVHLALRRARLAQLRRLAQGWQMHYTPDDRFGLAPRAAQALGVPGAAGVRVEDVIYGSEGESYRYYFTIAYTIGVVRRQSDQRCVCTATEKKARDAAHQMEAFQAAPMELPILEQYRRVKKI